MSLKTDTILLPYTFYQFEYFMTTCLFKKCFSEIALTEMT